jgi:hypothetical protein
MHLNLPETLTGPFCADHRGLPRYCSTIWIDVLNGHLAPSTRYRYASAANSLYLQAASMVPSVDLDAALLAPDFSAIERVLSSSLLARQADQDLRHWQLACGFAFSILENLVGSDDPAMKQRLRVMRQRFAQLRLRPKRPSNPGRSLPWLAVEDLYEIFDPTSQSRQKAARQVAAKFSKSSPALLAERLAAAPAEVQALKRQRDLLVAGHRAAILAIGRIGGMKAWREYFAEYSGALQDLKELGALPEAEIVRIAPVEVPAANP